MPSPVIVPELIVIVEEKAVHDDDRLNPYRVFPDAAKILVVEGLETPATAAIGELPVEQ
jgi:hypothetical protein